MNTQKNFQTSSEILQAQLLGVPVVALESTVITHGLPFPTNLSLAKDMERVVREEGAVPATIALVDGQVHIGISSDELRLLAESTNARKISLRDFGIAAARKLSGGTTVAATLHAAKMAGIKVFATGGIGGVHRNAPFDISADLPQLGKTPLVVVCAGAKSILDLPATLEYLETQGVPVIGFGTDELPAFYTSKSGFGVDYRVDTPEELAEALKTKWDLGIEGGVVVANPIPPEYEMDPAVIDSAISEAVREADLKGIKGKESTPFLLAKVKEITGGSSLDSNIQLVYNNAVLGAKIAVELSKLK